MSVNAKDQQRRRDSHSVGVMCKTDFAWVARTGQTISKFKCWTQWPDLNDIAGSLGSKRVQTSLKGATQKFAKIFHTKEVYALYVNFCVKFAIVYPDMCAKSESRFVLQK